MGPADVQLSVAGPASRRFFSHRACTGQARLAAKPACFEAGSRVAAHAHQREVPDAGEDHVGRSRDAAERSVVGGLCERFRPQASRTGRDARRRRGPPGGIGCQPGRGRSAKGRDGRRSRGEDVLQVGREIAARQRAAARTRAGPGGRLSTRRALGVPSRALRPVGGAFARTARGLRGAERRSHQAGRRPRRSHHGEGREALFAYTLDEPAQGSVAVQLALGDDRGWCAAAPARNARSDRAGRFVGTPTPPASCPPLPGPPSSPSGAFLDALAE